MAFREDRFAQAVPTGRCRETIVLARSYPYAGGLEDVRIGGDARAPTRLADRPWLAALAPHARGIGRILLPGLPCGE